MSGGVLQTQQFSSVKIPYESRQSKGCMSRNVARRTSGSLFLLGGSEQVFYRAIPRLIEITLVNVFESSGFYCSQIEVLLEPHEGTA